MEGEAEDSNGKIEISNVDNQPVDSTQIEQAVPSGPEAVVPDTISYQAEHSVNLDDSNSKPQVNNSQNDDITNIYPYPVASGDAENHQVSEHISSDTNQRQNITTQGQSQSQPLTSSDGLPNGPFPQELAYWNWGALFFNWIWSIANSVWIGLLAFISPIGLIMSIVLGIKGNEWAWKNRRFESIDQFKQVQRAWTRIGVIIYITVAALSMIAVGILVFFSLNSANSKASDARRMSDVESIYSGIAQYAVDNNKCPASLSVLAPTYINSVPKDQDTGQSYSYVKTSTKCTVSANIKNSKTFASELGSDDNPSNGSIYDKSYDLTNQ
jgi:hypothetical protein